MPSARIAPLLARLDDHLRPWLVRLPPRVAVGIYSRGRKHFLKWLVDGPPTPYVPPSSLSRTLWGLHFRAPLGNAAGMFKNGEGYELCAAQGAGWYLAGTSTELSRPGNRRHGIAQPFAPYPNSGAASNWLGLPNDGHAAIAARLARLDRVEGCPVGASVSATADVADEAERLDALVEGLERYRDAGIDFLELNESCPNTEELPPAAEAGAEACEDVLDSGLRRRLDTLAERFLRHRTTPLPVIVKFSTDTDPRQVPALLDLLLDLGFDGVNFGNTSTEYAALRPALANRAEQRLLDYFAGHFGGGVSGRPLREKSLALVRAARAHLDARHGHREFHIVRTGGVEGADDVRASEAAGASLAQWYTGYFDAFGRRGHGLYRKVYADLRAC